MWIVAYDPNDSSAVVDSDPLRYWPFRHGSPFHFGRSRPRVPAVWIPSDEVPAVKALGTAADLCLIHVDGGPRLSHHVRSPDDNPVAWAQAAEATLDRVVLVLEHTNNMDFGTNTIARVGNLFPASMQRIPTFIAVPGRSCALRQTGRTGAMTQKQRALTAKCADGCEDLVRANRPITVRAFEALVSSAGEGATNEMSWKMQLFMSILEDTNDVPAGVIVLPDTAVYFPDEWKMAGCQLAGIWAVLDTAITTWERSAKRLRRDSSVTQSLRRAADGHVKTRPPPSGRRPRERNTEWDELGARIGFPAQSKWLAGGGPEVDPLAYYPLMSPEMSEVLELSSARTFDEWVLARRLARSAKATILGTNGRLARTRVRPYGPLKLDLLPPALLARASIVTNHVKDHTARASAPIHQNVTGERTYLGRVQVMDLVNIRAPAPRPGLPRAVARDPRSRTHVLAVDLPIGADEFFTEYLINSRVRGWFGVADLLALEDGVYLGGPWAAKPGTKVKLT